MKWIPAAGIAIWCIWAIIRLSRETTKLAEEFKNMME